eukprot:CAMPEP_0198125292 /NCGR_PEP_ID=MMETSP1442-20131203/42292_1 /TAXON_ID= /ORGANISM="Craspedostauros australis, Strain CCMP3328" /LENGTH=400 /DNA_ID=CAMNT_0043784869 /DNA_START=75 /DNA_END=1277 /DNA_ORIENTATION=-
MSAPVASFPPPSAPMGERPPPLNPSYVAQDFGFHPGTHQPTYADLRPAQRIPSNGGTTARRHIDESADDNFQHDVLSFVFQTFDTADVPTLDGNSADMNYPRSRSHAERHARNESTRSSESSVPSSSSSYSFVRRESPAAGCPSPAETPPLPANAPRQVSTSNEEMAGMHRSAPHSTTVDASHRDSDSEAFERLAASFNPSNIQTVVMDEEIIDQQPADSDDNGSDNGSASANEEHATRRGFSSFIGNGWNRSKSPKDCKESTLKEESELSAKFRKMAWGTKRMATSTAKKAYTTARNNEENLNHIKTTGQKALHRSIGLVTKATAHATKQTQETVGEVVLPGLRRAAGKVTSTVSSKVASVAPNLQRRSSNATSGSAGTTDTPDGAQPAQTTAATESTL